MVATYNRPVQLAALLRALARMDYASDRFEVVIVDDGGQSSLEPVIGLFRDRLSILLAKQVNAGVGGARQLGLKVARGEYVAFTDDDCEPASDWLRMLERALTATPGCGVGGRTVNALPHNLCLTATQVLENYLRASWSSKPGGEQFFGTANLALPADRCRAIGGFESNWAHGGEDRDLCARWTELGHPLVYAPEAVVSHAHSLSFFAFVRQHFRYGQGAFLFRRALAARRRRRIELDSLWFYLRLPFSSFSEVGGVRAVWVAALLAISQLANAVGFFLEWMRQGRTQRKQRESARREVPG